MVGLYFLAVIGKIALTPQDFQVDILTYYYAAEAHSKSLNPYDKEVLTELAGRPVHLKYYYPPLILYLFKLLTLFSYSGAYYLYLALKVAVLCGLFWVWERKYLDTKWDGLFFLLCLFGFNYTIYCDLSTANVSLFEELLLWLAFAAFVQGRFQRFGILVACTAMFKLLPLFFLVLLLRTDDPRRWRYLVQSGAFFGLYLGISALVEPKLFLEFVASLTGLTGGLGRTGEVANPATWPLIQEVFRVVGEKGGVVVPRIIQAGLFAVAVVGVIVITWWAGEKARGFEAIERRKWQVCLACFVFALIIPRFMNYSYILLLAPTYFLLQRLGRVSAYLMVLLLMLVSTSPYRPPGFNLLVSELSGYHPLFVAYVLWALAVHHLATWYNASTLGGSRANVECGVRNVE
ncbi:MAG: DUF2029 domain-containing protein [Candidatus Hydrogenedentes bacterium]|nr:DUF2029 domain-containing protein [Candidatus Hydrogenedentota bacterium]